MVALLLLACGPQDSLRYLGRLEAHTGFAWLDDENVALLVGDGNDGRTRVYTRTTRRGLRMGIGQDLVPSRQDVVLDALAGVVLATGREDAATPVATDDLYAVTWDDGEPRFVVPGLGTTDARMLSADDAVAYDDRACTITFITAGIAQDTTPVERCRPGAFAADATGRAFAVEAEGEVVVLGYPP